MHQRRIGADRHPPTLLLGLVVLLLACRPLAPQPPARTGPASSPEVAGSPRGVASPLPGPGRPVPPSPAATASPSPSPPAARPAPYDLAFARDGSLWLARLDGASLRLTQGRRDGDPQWSPDGARLAFVRGGGVDAELYVVAADGSGLRRLTNDRVEQRDPRWSPRNDLVAYVQPRDTNGNGAADPTEDTEIWLIPSAGGGAQKLVDGFDPAWAPDGSRLAYVSNGVRQGGPPAGAAQNALAVVEWPSRAGRELLPAGAVPQNLEQSHGLPFRPGTFRLRAPSWSADGRRLSLSADGHSALALTVDPSGADPRVWLLNYEGGVGRTHFGPRGTTLAIESRPATGYERVQLTDTADGPKTEIGSEQLDVSAAQPAWAPDGQRLAVVTWSGPNGRTAPGRELLVFDLRGRPLAQVAVGDVGDPAWNPAR